ncbi:MAG: YitT family protein [Bacteroidaceae bacterium]|nr:YitT family protein [Prevotellaceae bacterium]MDY5632066.1 YitT family protein [Bacteroidaceae bacterium]
MREKIPFKDILQMLAGIVVYCIGYTCFILPYQITTGGVAGVSALIYYATGFPVNVSYLAINAALIAIALYTMGWRYCLKTMVSIGLITLGLSFCQEMVTTIGPDGQKVLKQIVGEQKWVACVIGGLAEGLGLAFVFLAGGSTGGTDIVASSVNKYKDISLGRALLITDLTIITSSLFIIHDIEVLVISYMTLIISMTFLDFVVNSTRQSVQFTIISEHYDEIAQRVSEEIERGVTILNGQGWYSKEARQVLLIMARKNESREIFRLIRQIDPRAFVTMSNVEGVFGEGFDVIKK